MSNFQEKKQYLENEWYNEMKFEPKTFNEKYYERLSKYFTLKEKVCCGDLRDYSYYDGVMTGMRIVREYLIQTLIVEEEKEGF